MDVIFTFISENYPTIGLMIVVAIIVYMATMYHVLIQNTRKKVDKLPCDDHGKILDSYLKKLEDVSVSIQNTNKRAERLPCDNHREQLSEISMWIMKKD